MSLNLTWTLVVTPACIFWLIIFACIHYTVYQITIPVPEIRTNLPIPPGMSCIGKFSCGNRQEVTFSLLRISLVIYVTLSSMLSNKIRGHPFGTAPFSLVFPAWVSTQQILHIRPFYFLSVSLLSFISLLFLLTIACCRYRRLVLLHFSYLFVS